MCSSHPNKPFCWWKKSGEPVEVGSEHPTIYRVAYMSGGCLGFLPSTVSLHSTHQLQLPQNFHPTYLSCHNLSQGSPATKSLIFHRATTKRGPSTKSQLCACVFNQNQPPQHPSTLVDSPLLMLRDNFRNGIPPAVVAPELKRSHSKASAPG